MMHRYSSTGPYYPAYPTLKIISYFSVFPLIWILVYTSHYIGLYLAKMPHFLNFLAPILLLFVCFSCVPFLDNFKLKMDNVINRVQM